MVGGDVILATLNLRNDTWVPKPYRLQHPFLN
jgi:hypothetical protein